MLATPSCLRRRRPGACRDLRVPSIHRPPGDKGPPRLGCTPDRPPHPLHPPPVPLLGRPLLVAQRRWLLFVVEMSVLPPGPFSFALPSIRVCGFSPLARPRRLYHFPIPVSPVIAPPFFRCLSRRVWGVTLEHFPRHRQDTQA